MEKFSIQYQFQGKNFNASVELMETNPNDPFYRVTTAGVVLDIAPVVHPDTAEICWKERKPDIDEPREASVSDLVQTIGEAIYQEKL